MVAGECFVRELGLGEVPARRLMDVLQNDLSILILMLDLPKGISGAFCHLPEFDALLVSRKQVIGRRNCDVAHQLFHILTWDSVLPRHSPMIGRSKLNRSEKLADGFAGALLMQRDTIERYGDWNELSGKQLISKLNQVADELQVGAVDLKWRLVALNKISKQTANAISAHQLRDRDELSEGLIAPLPDLFSESYLDVAGKSIDRGLVSVRRMCKLLDLTVEDLNGLYLAYGLPYSIDL